MNISLVRFFTNGKLVAITELNQIFLMNNVYYMIKFLSDI